MSESIQTILNSLSKLPEQEGRFGYSSVNWHWLVESNHFRFDDPALNGLLEQQGIHAIEDILALFTKKDRARIVQTFRAVSESGIAQDVFCCLVTPATKTLIYAYWKIETGSDKEVAGSVRPVFTIENMGKVADFFQQIFDNNHHGVVVTDTNTRILACNHYFATLTGYSIDELIGLKTSHFNAGKHSKVFFDEMWSQIHRHGYWSGTVLTKRKNGKIEPQDLTIQKIEQQDGKVFYVGFSVDLSNHLYRVADKELGGIELLTQLPSESQFNLNLLELIEEYHPLHNIMVMSFVPDSEGIDKLDLRMDVSGAIAKTDSRYLCGYLSDNLFVVALHCAKGPQNVRLIHNEIKTFFQALRKNLKEHIYKRVTMGTIGVSILGYDTSSPKSMVKHATQAMLERHSSSGQNISFYDRGVHQEAARRKALEEALLIAIRNQSIMVYYQPIVSTNDWRIVKFEALCRFPELNGQVYPVQEVINLAEDLDLITKIDQCVGQKALSQLAQIHEHFGPDVGVTINRSLNTSISTQKVLASAMELVQQSKVDPELITIELTESAYFSSEEQHIEALQKMRDLGMKVAIDDFGSGYSSLAYLSDGHFDYLKIDRSFVKDIEVGTNRYFIIKYLVNLSHTLGVSVVAEGAENISEVRTLARLGVDYIQGFFFSRPVAINHIEKARAYTKNLHELRPISVPKQGEGILKLCDFTIPSLHRTDSLQDVQSIFNQSHFDALPVVEEGKCFGYVDRETLALNLTPSLGTKLETLSDGKILKRKVAQVLRRDHTELKTTTPVSEVAQLVRRKAKLPWIVLNEKGEFQGIVSNRQLLDFFAK
ncbi:EAL domain-containing protein [Vibrio sp. SCSIO 43136]|uniref:EAL domain-containing protein n=1 Tax=Vibrio sp. SCSIO 43136 TaxID=2819101 RepID=UPI0020750AB3|nr:EAL domain-containing protein [Vibrio sp. SCSIO 43136]USD64183.1 EAL domain-containing protein [Vibrio sp. SCSIO 43136]